RLSRVGQLTAGGGGAVLESFDGQTLTAEILPLGKAAFAQLKRTLFSDRKRGKLQVFAQGTAAEFRQFLDLYGKTFIREGYQIHILGTLGRLVALRVTKSNRTWWLCDAEAVSGVPLKEISAHIAALGPVAGKSGGQVVGLFEVLRVLQREMVTRFGVALHPTI